MKNNNANKASAVIIYSSTVLVKIHRHHSFHFIVKGAKKIVSFHSYVKGSTATIMVCPTQKDLRLFYYIIKFRNVKKKYLTQTN